MRRRVRRLLFRLSYAVLVTSVAAAAVVWGGVLFDWPRATVGVASLFVGLESILYGLALATNWCGGSARMRAWARRERPRHGRVYRWVCREELAWWRANGALLAAVGAFCVFQAYLVGRG